MKRSAVIAACVLASACAVMGQASDPFGLLGGLNEPTAADKLEVSAVASHTQVAPGERLHVAMEMRITPGWVYYSPDPGQYVLPGKLDVQAPGLAAGEPLWPKDKPKTTALDEKETVTNNTYADSVRIYVPLDVPADAEPGPRTVTLIPGGQICDEVCLDIQDVSAVVTFEVGSETVPNPAWNEQFTAGIGKAMTAGQLKASHKKIAAPAAGSDVSASTTGLTLWGGLGLALLAGLTLNIMPCVLPVVPLRILSIVGMAHESRRRFVTLGLAFALGMLLFFVGLAIISGVLRVASSQALNVSDHFQYPAVRIALAMVLVALAANLFGVFDVVVPSRVASAEGPGKREGHLKSVGMGFMMAVLATPCSFAFLLTAMAWAQVQPLWLGTLAILLIGVGMAAPHALLSAFPDLVKKLPKPGRWMEIFKHAMGFLLLPVAIWLLSTLGGSTWPFWVAGYGVVLTFALWMWGKWVRYDASPARKLAVRLPALAIAVAGGLWMLPPPAPSVSNLVSFESGQITVAREEGRVALVKVTAAWCLECKVIEHRVYNTSEIAEALETRNVLAMEADVTDRASAASQWLRANGGGAPPITLIYPPDGSPPTRLVGGFDQAKLLDALSAAAAKR